MKYFSCIDLEASCWEKTDSGGDSVNHQMEIIELACVVTDKNFNEIARFDKFVQPILHPDLSDYCTNLTTIKQQDVNNAETFDKVHKSFVQWIRTISEDKNDFLFCSWGKYDEKQLRQDCALHNLIYPFNDEHCNLKNVVAKKVGAGKKHRGMKAMLEYLKLPLEGTHHRGIDDVLNILKICRRSQITLRDMIPQ